MDTDIDWYFSRFDEEAVGLLSTRCQIGKLGEYPFHRRGIRVLKGDGGVLQLMFTMSSHS
jgi:hypothetical protein